jgi:hypothetical protein
MLTISLLDKCQHLMEAIRDMQWTVWLTLQDFTGNVRVCVKGRQRIEKFRFAPRGL